MGGYIHKSHNKSMLLYHLVCTVKYRRNVLTDEVKTTLVNTCMNIQDKYDDMKFIEIGTDQNHVHMLIQTTPSYSLSQTIRVIKSTTSRMIFKLNPEVKKQLWGGEFWSDGYWVVTVSKHGSETTIKEYVKNQGKNKYEQLYFCDESLSSPDSLATG